MNLYVALDLDSRVMKQAITEILRRHRAFRTFCKDRDGAEVLCGCFFE
jgi:hypothetical protein